MGKIFCIMGKSATGKDSVYQLLLEKEKQLHKIILYTTRPIRQGEESGREYFFCTEDKVKEFESQNKLIELRAYHTVYGIWKYFMADDGQFDLSLNNYVVIGTLESYTKMRDYFGKHVVFPVYIEVEDGERLLRAIQREKNQKVPQYEEMCRRFLADAEDFSEENLERAEIRYRFTNQKLEDTVMQISAFIKDSISCAVCRS